MTTPRLGTQEQKLEFLLAVIPFLDAHQDVTVREVAERFNVNVDDVLALINRLPMFGYPHDDLVDDPGTMFDTNEPLELTADSLVELRTPSADLVLQPKLSHLQAVSLIMGLQRLEKVSHPELLSTLRTLGEKISSGSQTRLDDVPIIVDEPHLKFLLEIQTSIQQKTGIVINYVNAQGTEKTHHIFPIMLKNNHGNWLIIAHSEDYNDDRIYRLDRIQQLENMPSANQLDDTIRERILDTEQYQEGIFYQFRDGLIPVTARIVGDFPEALKRFYPKKLSANTYQIEVERAVNIARIVAAIPEPVEIIGPDSVIGAVREWIENTLNQYRDDSV